jgi:uncharacterized membrane protein YdjX (TVP38/TMEM64 family)
MTQPDIHERLSVGQDPSSAVEVGDENNSTTEPEFTEEELLEKKRNCYKKTAVALILIAFVAFVVADSLTNGYIKDGIDNFLEWIEANPAGGVFVFMLVIFVTTILFVPGVILTLGAGFVFANTFGLGVGVLLGTVAAFVGAFAGAMASFLLGRFLFRDCVSGLTKKYAIFEALDNAFEEKGFRIMALLRLSPLIYVSPYLNYGAGGTAISFWAYFWALFAILPGTVLYVFLGASAGSLADTGNSGDDNDSPVTTIVLVVGIVFSFLAVALTSYYAKKELNKATANRRADLWDDAITTTEEENDATITEEENNDATITEEISMDDVGRGESLVVTTASHHKGFILTV